MEIRIDQEERGSPQRRLAYGGVTPLLTSAFNEQGVVHCGHEHHYSSGEGNHHIFAYINSP